MKIINIKNIVLGLGLLVAFQTFAQDMNTHYSYQLNWFNINPAYTGETKGINAMFNQKTQWTGLEGSPSNSMIAMHSQVKDNMGLGAKVILDKRGLLSNFSAELNYSYKIKFSDSKKLSFGLSAGIFQSYLDEKELLNDQFTDLTDPVITKDFVNTLNTITSFGVMYKTKNLEVGASAPHLASTGNGLSDHLVFMTKYRIQASSKFAIIPSVVAQSLSNSPNQLDGGIKFAYDSLVWLQFIYKTTGTIVPALGFDMQNFSFAYAYSASQKVLSDISPSSHEVLISFTFDKNSEKNLSKKRSKHLKTILTNLDELNSNSSSSELDKEVKELQLELSGLVDKMKNNEFTEEDEKRMNEIAVRINKIKTQQ